MNSLVRPVGSASPATYWRRRAIVVAFAVLVAYAIVQACSPGPPADDPASTSRQLNKLPPAPGESSTPSQVGESSPSSGGEEEPDEAPTDDLPGGGEATQVSGGAGEVRPGYCLDENVRLDVRPSKRQYVAGENPTFTLLFVNVGEAPCKFDIGPGGWSMEIMSGRTRIWSSDDCGDNEASDPQTLHRLTPVSVEIDWDRRRSEPECPAGERTEAKPGTYTVTARAGDVASPPVVFVIES